MAATGSGKTLLIVEDNDALRLGLAGLLQREGYSVLLAANGAEALGFLDAGVIPDLVLLDMLMPVLDGWHFLQQLQQRASCPRVPILVTTASTVIGREWVQVHGCGGVLRKPVDRAEVLREVRRLLPQGAAGEEPVS